MGFLFLLIFLVISVGIVGLVLLQEGKGGGLTGMSTGMDGVMGVKNPLRKWTAYLFVAFVFMAIIINWFFHQRNDTSLPAGVAIPQQTQTLEQTTPLGETVVVPEGGLRPSPAPEAEGETAPSVRPEGGEVPPPPPPADSLRPEGTVEAAGEETAAGQDGESVESVQAEIESLREEIAGQSDLRPEPTPEAPAASVQPPSAESEAAAGEAEPEERTDAAPAAETDETPATDNAEQSAE